MSGHLLPLVTNTPLSVLTTSVGKPCIAQSRNSTGVDRVPARLKLGEIGMPSTGH